MKLPGLFCTCSVILRQKGEYGEDEGELVKTLHRLYRIGRLVGAVLVPVGLFLAAGMPEASAAPRFPVSGNQYCESATSYYGCLNAWGGGPYVKAYIGSIPSVNNNFTLIHESNGYYELEFTGPGSWGGQCIGDAHNNPDDADTSLDPCGTNGAGAGWGTQFTYTNCAFSQYQFSFYNRRWKGYLSTPKKFVNGTSFYLNTPESNSFCFQQYETGT